MKRFSLILSFLSVLLFAIPALAEELTIYTYDSFNSEWGPGPSVFPAFEKACGCKIKVVAPGDAGTVLNKAILEKKNPKADIILGLNNSQLGKVLKYDVLEAYQSPKAAKINQSLVSDPQFRVTPFDYGFLAFVYDSEKIKNPPKSLKDLLKPEFKNKIVIENPKTSSPGLSMLHWTIAAFGESGYLDYWKKLSPNLLTVTPGWSAAYGMFTKGETPIVLSYATSPAYHLEYEKTERYQAAVFSDGHYRQIEYAGIVKGTKNRKLAEKFIDFTLSEEFQAAIPLTNWMFPVIEYGSLPESFKIAPKPKAVGELPSARVDNQNKYWLKKWSRAVAR